MSFFNVPIFLILWLYTHSPPYLINEYINGLQMTSDPDTYMTPPQIITRHGYPAETHIVQTSDGFLLQLHRIPYGISGEGANDRYPILLTHGLEDSSAAWIINGPDRSLSYLLADQGYDVWLMNMRGNMFSMSHTNYTPMQKEFWDFSFHEIGIYDLPACIDYILGKTNHEKLFHIGHSIGPSILYILLSVLPQYNNKVIAQIALAPLYVETSEHTYDLLWAEPAYDAMNYLYWNTPGNIPLEHDLLIKFMWRFLNLLASFGLDIRDLLLYIVFGLTFGDIDAKTRAVIYNNYPGGGSMKCLLQILQFYNSFSFFDYGPEENMKFYGTSQAPQYNMSNIHVPIRLYAADSDPIATPQDVAKLYEVLPVKAGLVKIADPLFSHLDFVYNKNVNELLNHDVLSFINYIIFDTISNTTNSPIT